MRSLLSILGILFIVAWVIERWASRRFERRLERERAERRGNWWQEPPGDGPEGDY